MISRHFSRRRLSTAVLGALATVPAIAQTTDAPKGSLEEVVVSVSRQAQKSFDAPASVQTVTADAIEAAGPRVNLSESVRQIPGIVALNRQNYAQDLQLSIRGFGVRTPFGIRGARILVDGIPATMPDGQSQASTINLASVQRIEVLRGPLAQLYGNSAGGVLQVFTADGPARPMVSTSVDVGSNGMQRIGVQTAGQTGALNYVVDYSDFATDGWRDHSDAKRKNTNIKLRWAASDDTRVTLIANLFDQPYAGDPQGLTRAQFQSNPRQVVPAVTAFDASKNVSQEQLGLAVDHKIDADSAVSSLVYAGQRSLLQRQSTPLSVQASATAAGGVVQLNREYSGAGLRYTRRFVGQDSLVQWTTGLDYERMSELRRGFINNQGVIGALKRDEDDSVDSTGLYSQIDWAINEQWSALAGVRANRVNFKVQDHYIRTGNADDSGRAHFNATNPVLGITRHLTPDVNLYANVGRGFETPTFTEIAYTPNTSGPNLGLRPAVSTHAEIGVKARVAPGQRLDAALFHIATNDEIVVSSSSGGRTIYTNAGRTRRSGFELAYHAELSPEWRAQVALTALNATFADAFTSSSGARVAAGNRVPGAVNRSVFAELAWTPRAVPGMVAALELTHQGRIAVDDLNTDKTSAATLLNLRVGFTQQWGGWTFKEQLRVENLTNRAYVGSVIVNDSNQRYFEPAPGRHWGLGVSATYRF